ncbi:hypothetical protein ACV30U_14755 [Clostridium perfringens]|jgi:hypothetical protein|uniref:hypothetical protein n=1 Tax=Clostridium perfringens TaxID=1502 RepID=UPI001C84957A|nr:hypothetical protein [Clostridium perfringens]UCR75237.1 hypothetical protein BG3P_23 [Clostridium phage vB_CpeS_BG3P]ELP5177572.1 hypothetical protein [Clostridium perfringens]MDM0716527.1 hypothetical protein [Clostridium perfringens]MDM0903873.1 hypothetical protein [Clostridium perfringens]HBI7026643.1 hypothetical protein [Clostridium perfringens]
MTKAKTHREFLEEVKNKFHGEYIVLGQYKNWKTKILVRHNCDNCKKYEWEIAPTNLLKGYGCPICSVPPQKTVLGINTIWDTDRWMCDLGISEEDSKKYSRGSGKKITITCPDCGKEKKIVIKEIYNRKSISCSCGDGKSYPEKFVMNVLEQLNINFEIEYKPKWIDNKRYDFYIKDFNCIVETHGSQHYSRKFTIAKARTLEEEQSNDKYKKEMAFKNGVKHYIELDCRESNLEWIKNSILNSKLNELFDLSKINWNKCAEFASKNIVKEVCEYWNNKIEEEGTVNIGKHFNIARGTVVEYLNKGTKLGWCQYSGKEELKKCGINSGKASSKKVEIFKDNQSLGIFNSCAELSRQSEELFGVKLLTSKISLVCNNKKPQYKGFNFKYL